jgi:hypothetical protein
MNMAGPVSHNNKQTMLTANSNSAKRKPNDSLQNSDTSTSITRQNARMPALESQKMDKEQPKKKRKNNSGVKIRACAKMGCTVTEKVPGVSFHRLPPYPDKPAPNASLKKNCNLSRKMLVASRVE